MTETAFICLWLLGCVLCYPIAKRWGGRWWKLIVILWPALSIAIVATHATMRDED